MFQKKPIYIVGIILFTLLLIADLLVFFLMPAGVGMGNMPTLDPGTFDGAGFGAMAPEGAGKAEFIGQALGANTGGGLLRSLRSGFWPILIVCILADVLCVFMLFRIFRKNKNVPEEVPLAEDEDSTPERDHTNTLLAVIAVILAVAVFVSGLPSGGKGSTATAQTATCAAEAGIGDLVSHFSGSGTLSGSDAEEIEIPASVTVTSYAVKNGDRVEAGDVIAMVDKTSVQNAIYEVQTLISELDAELKDVRSDTLDDTITSRAEGRVKVIYAQTGESVESCMYEHGALMLISLGGSMTVVIESDEAVAVGQTLTVTLSDGTQVEGKVQQTRGGKITVTTTDDGPLHGDTVTVATQEGVPLGGGSLTVSSPLLVTGYFGTVSKINVAVGARVKAGTKLITLRDTEDLARYQYLLRTRGELEDYVDELNRMYQDGCIKAGQSGIISMVDEDVAYAPLSADLQESRNASELSVSSASEGFRVTLLSNLVLLTETEPAGTATEPTAPPTEPTAPPTEPTAPPTEPTAPPTEPADTPTEPTDTPTEPAPVLADGTYAGKVKSIGYNSMQFQISEMDVTGATIAAVAAMPDAMFTSVKELTPSASVAVNVYQDGQLTPSSVSAIQSGDKVLLYVSGGVVVRIDYIAAANQNPGGNTQWPSGGGNMQFPSFGGGFGYSYGAQEDEEPATYEVKTTCVCAVTPAETMTIAVNVDELDILNLAVGQKADVTLDALPGQSFAGSVKRIAQTGTSENGGSTKYTVTMEVPRTEQMLDGMNASVLIEVGRLRDVLTIPAEAVYEDGTRTYVYTAVDAKTGEPANPVDVATGASDGNSIQILEGLQPGDTVYYSYADSIVYRTEV